MLEKILKTRFLLVIAVFFLLVNTLLFLISGAVQSYHGYMEFISNGFHLGGDTRPGLHILEGLDAFMIALVFMVFGLGIAKLFVFDQEKTKMLPSWLNIHNLKELKVLLWETILVTLVILCITNLIKSPPSGWDALVFPSFILILSLALLLLKAGDFREHK